jgi:hypothetical protein
MDKDRYSEELCDLQRSFSVVLITKPEGKRPCERQRHRWEDGIKMDLREIGWEGCRVDLPGLG